MKKVSFGLCMLLLAALIVFAFSSPVQAASRGTCGGNVTWMLDDSGTLTISGSGAMEDYASASAAPWYSQRTAVKAVVIENGVTTIGTRAFYNCTALTDVTIGSDVQTIGAYAFRGCTALTEVFIPANVTALNDSAFRACTALTVVAFGGDAPTIGNYAFNDGAASLTVEYFEGSTGYDVSPWTDYILSAQHVGQWIVDSEASCTSDGSRHIDCTYCNATFIETLPGGHKYVDGFCTVCGEMELIASGTCGENVQWKLDGRGILTISGSGAMYNSWYEDFPWYSYREQIIEVVIEDGVTSIGWGAFSGCSSLTSVTIPDSVTRIGGYAFYDCSSLTSVTIPDSVTSIGEYAFENCSSLTSITIPESVTSIGWSAFYGCSSLTSITIPESVTSIGENAFSGCSSLMSITIPESVTSIDSYAFYGCSSLTDVYITDPSAWCRISFGDRYSVPMSNGVELHILDANGEEVTEVELDESVTTIPQYAFKNCSSLTSITIPESVTSIGSSAFSGCTGLTSITLGGGVTSIGGSAFSGCSSLTSITIPDSVTSIGGNAFLDCENLKDVYITDPSAWCGISFEDWYSVPMVNGAELHIMDANGEEVTEVVLDSSVTTIPAHAFKGSSLSGITIPDSVTSIGESAFENCSSLTSVSIPEGITIIQWDTFSGCSSLTSITIPDSVTSIGSEAFSGCSSLTSITIPDSVTSIGVYAFYDCSSLTSITIPSSITAIGNNTFYRCTSLTFVNIPEGVTSIGDSAFSGCTGLVSIVIPDSVTHIGDWVFSACTSLNTVFYRGAEARKPSISLGADGNLFTDTTWHYEVTDAELEGIALYHCGKCDGYFYPDGTKFSLAQQPILTGESFSLSFEDEILVNFYYTAENTADVVEQGMLVFYTDPGKADFNKADDVYTDSRYVESSGSYIVTTHGIAAKEMGDDRYYCAYAKLSDGSYAYSKLYQYSPKKYAMNMLGKASTSEKQKALCVAMLNYGAAAQEYFGYRPDDLMNAGLTEEQKALVSPYDASLFKGTVPADPGKTGVFIATDGFGGKSASVSFEGAFSINFYFIPNEVADTDLIFYYWTEEDYANAETLTPTNASGKLSMELKDGFYMASVKGIAPKDLDKTYYVAGAYVSDMQIRCTGVIAYSLSKYCMNNAYGNMGDLARATAMYGYYAKNFFA